MAQLSSQAALRQLLTRPQQCEVRRQRRRFVRLADAVTLCDGPAQQCEVRPQQCEVRQHGRGRRHRRRLMGHANAVTLCDRPAQQCEVRRQQRGRLTVVRRWHG
eukprot:scaffold178506_cov15-Tisochrysis_lutea.AAC.1